MPKKSPSSKDKAQAEQPPRQVTPKKSPARRAAKPDSIKAYKPLPERPRVGRREKGASSSGSNALTHPMSPDAVNQNPGGLVNGMVDEFGMAAKNNGDYMGALVAAERIGVGKAIGKTGGGMDLAVNPQYLLFPAVPAVIGDHGFRVSF